MVEAKTNLLLINGPNLNMLGRRDPHHYGTFSLKDVEELVVATAKEHGFSCDCYQSNHEGCLIDQIQAALGSYAGILLNAGAFTHTSYALRDALELTGLPVLEIHISNIYEREPFRHISVISPVCLDQVVGLGLASYKVATAKLCAYLKGKYDAEG